MFHDAAKEMVALLRQAHFIRRIKKGVHFTVLIPDGNMHVAAVSGEGGKRLRHERRA
jgi:hypothetical protein